jgi:putative membrane protein
MNRLRDISSRRVILIAALAAFAGCGSASQRQQPVAAATVAPAPEAAASKSAAQAHAKPVATNPQTSPVVSTKQNNAAVLSQLHQADLTEISLGQMAEEKASTDEVRAYAVQLIQDHTNVDQAVMAMASKTRVNLAQRHMKPLDIKLRIRISTNEQ